MDKYEILSQYKIKREEYDLKTQRLEQKISLDIEKFDSSIKEMERVINVAHNTEFILNNFEMQFYESTQLTPQDDLFLFLAIALQCTRWFFQPKINTVFEKINRSDRHKAIDDGNEERRQRRTKLEQIEQEGEASDKFISIKKMFLYPVPYDAMEGTQRIVIPGVSEANKQLYGGNHHSATMGHDPILGYIFGTANIMTRSITFKNPTLQTCEVHLKRNTYLDPKKYSGQYVSDDMPLSVMVDQVIGSIRQDVRRLPAGITRQAMHLASDKYCKDGLPIPFISAERAQELLKEDWNSNELSRLTTFLAKDATIVSGQALFSTIINVIIEQLHKLCYTPDMGVSKTLYEVKTRRIIEISNIIASSTNLIYSAVLNDISKLDLGGLLITLYRIWKDDLVIKRIKHDFVYGSYYDLIKGDAKT